MTLGWSCLGEGDLGHPSAAALDIAYPSRQVAPGDPAGVRPRLDCSCCRVCHWREKGCRSRPPHALRPVSHLRCTALLRHVLCEGHRTLPSPLFSVHSGDGGHSCCCSGTRPCKRSMPSKRSRGNNIVTRGHLDMTSSRGRRCCPGLATRADRARSRSSSAGQR